MAKEKVNAANGAAKARPLTPQKATNNLVSVESIRNGAKVINDKLLAKGYLSARPGRLSKLYFESTDREELAAQDGDSAWKAYENDRNTINVIFSLMDSLEVAVLYKESSLRKLAEKDSKIISLEARVASLERQLEHKRGLIQSAEREKKRQSLTLQEERARADNLAEQNRSWERQMQMYSGEVERKLRRSKVEVDRLTARLQHQGGELEVRKRRRVVSDSFTARRDSQGQLRSSNGVSTMIEDARKLAKDTNTALCFVYKVYNYLRQKHESMIGTTVTVPNTFVPTNEELLSFDRHKYTLENLDRLVVALSKQIGAETVDDTFGFKKVEENKALKRKLGEAVQANEKLLKTVDEWRKFREQ